MTPCWPVWPLPVTADLKLYPNLDWSASSAFSLVQRPGPYTGGAPRPCTRSRYIIDIDCY